MATFTSATSPSASHDPTPNLSLKKVGTHNGRFYCDEALGCFMIRLTQKFSNAQIVRSRDPKVLATLDAVLDVGGVYNPNCHRYNHHQKGFEDVFGHGFNTKLSSASLVYKHFGKKIIAKELRVDEEHPDVQSVEFGYFAENICLHRIASEQHGGEACNILHAAGPSKVVIISINIDDNLFLIGSHQQEKGRPPEQFKIVIPKIPAISEDEWSTRS